MKDVGEGGWLIDQVLDLFLEIINLNFINFGIIRVLYNY